MMQFFRQLSTTGAVITALVLRETKTRFGKTKMGYFWALLEPLVYVAFFLVIRTSLREVAAFGESIVLFLSTGLLVCRVFIAITGKMLGSVSGNKALLAYPPVKPNDVMAARFILEALTMYVVMALFFSVLSLVVEFPVIVNYPEFFAAIGAVTLLGAGFGTFNAVFSVLVPAWARVWGIIRLPLFIMSGIFYLPKGMPAEIQDILWWNPVLHCVEWIRVGTYLSYDPLLNETFVLTMGVGFLVAGLALEKIYRFRLLSA